MKRESTHVVSVHVVVRGAAVARGGGHGGAVVVAAAEGKAGLGICCSENFDLQGSPRSSLALTQRSHGAVAFFFFWPWLGGSGETKSNENGSSFFFLTETILSV
jgi:hypothetical protein